MPFFRKKPVVIEAEQFTQKSLEDHLFDDKPLPCGLVLVGSSYHPHTRTIYSFRAGVPTLEGFMEAVIGDWIIKGVQGEFYPCKNTIFLETYEPVE